MRTIEAGGKGTRVWRNKLSEYIKLASTDDRIVAFAMHPLQIMATFFTFVEGYASPTSQSWPIYVRRTVNNKSWTAGSTVSLGDPNIRIPRPYEDTTYRYPITTTGTPTTTTTRTKPDKIITQFHFIQL